VPSAPRTGAIDHSPYCPCAERSAIEKSDRRVQHRFKTPEDSSLVVPIFQHMIAPALPSKDAPDCAKGSLRGQGSGKTCDERRPRGLHGPRVGSGAASTVSWRWRPWLDVGAPDVIRLSDSSTSALRCLSATKPVLPPCGTMGIL